MRASPAPFLRRRDNRRWTYKPSGKAAYCSTLRIHLIPALGDKPLSAITTKDVQRLKSMLHRKAPKNRQQRADARRMGPGNRQMIGWGAAVQESERGALAGYLADLFGPIRPPRMDRTGHPGGSLVETRCLGCHDGRLGIEQQRLSWQMGGGGEIEKMRGWGAPFTDVEKEALAEYLASRQSP